MTRSPIFSYWIAFVACLGGFLQSYVTCVIAGALIFLSVEFDLSPFRQGNVASIILMGAILGALSSGYLADRFGRRYTLFLSALIYLITALFSYFANSFDSLMVLRFITGIAVGISSMLVPMYLAEIAPPAKRGAFVTCYQFSITIGTLIAYLVNLLAHENWRMMFFLAAVPAAFQFISLLFLPESPKWLIARGRISEANEVIKRIGGDISQTSSQDKIAQGNLFSSPFFLLIAIGVVLSAFQQFSGINAVVYFTPKIFSEAGLSNPKDALFATLLFGVVNVLATFITILVVDRYGRRKLLLISQVGILSMLLVLILSFATNNPLTDLISVGAVILYVFLYSLGLGPIVWVLISEIFPVNVRAKALAFCTFISWLSNYLVVLSFPHFLFSFGATWTFSIYGLLSLFALAFFAKYIPETKGKSLEQLEKLLVNYKK